MLSVYLVKESGLIFKLKTLTLVLTCRTGRAWLRHNNRLAADWLERRKWMTLCAFCGTYLLTK